MMRLSSDSKPISLVTRAVKRRHPLQPQVSARQETVPGFDQARLARAHILLIGAGGLGSEIGQGLVRKGIGAITVLDHDSVEVTNLTRQRFFERDRGKNKAVALVRNLAMEATARTNLLGYPLSFQDAVSKGISLDSDVVVCGVDNDETRVEVARQFVALRPVVFAGTSRDADSGYVFVQEPGKACFVCQFPDAWDSSSTAACVPSEIAILKTISGFVLYAIDSLLMPRVRTWNYRALSLSGSWNERSSMVERQPECKLCGSRP